jgi:hypothetical protein
MTGCLGFARESLIIGEQGIFAELAKFGKLSPQRLPEFQPRPRSVGHPQFNNSNERLHRDIRVAMLMIEHRRSRHTWLAQIVGRDAFESII